jgi:hypothetical protein
MTLKRFNELIELGLTTWFDIKREEAKSKCSEPKKNTNKKKTNEKYKKRQHTRR